MPLALDAAAPARDLITGRFHAPAQSALKGPPESGPAP